MNQAGKSTLKTFLLITSIVAGIIILAMHFTVFPGLIKVMNEVSPDSVGAVKNKLNYITVGYLVFLLLENLFFWSKDSLLEKEEENIQKNLKINPNDPAAQANLKKVNEKRKFYLNIAEPLFIVALGIIITFLVRTILIPLYSIVSL